MGWQITAAIAASATLLFSLFMAFGYPRLQRWRRSKPLLRIDTIRRELIRLQSKYMKPQITDKEITAFKKAIKENHVNFLNELKRISRVEARLYRNLGSFQRGLFEGVNNEKQWKLLSSNKRLIEIIERVIDKYS